MGWWLLQLTIEILANLQLTINNFPLRSPEMSFFNGFFNYWRLQFVNFYT